MFRLKERKKGQTRVFEALLAVTVIAIALTTPKPAPTQPAQPPNSPQKLLDYLVYSGTIQYGLAHPQELAQTLNAATGNAPWRLTVYTCSGSKVLEAQNGSPTQAVAATALLYSPTCMLVVLEIGG